MAENIRQLTYIAGFGVIGVLSRYWCGVAIGEKVSTPFPVATFFVNVLGAFLIGVVYVFSVERSFLSEPMRFGLMVGFLGGFTTFSSLCFELVSLGQAGNFRTAIIYFVLSSALGVLGCISGMFLARSLS